MTSTPLATEINVDEVDRLIDVRGFKSRRALTIKAEIDPGHFSRICAGKADPGLRTLRRLSRALDARVSDIIYDDDEPSRLSPVHAQRSGVGRGDQA